MILDAIGESLPMSVGIALSPLPVTVVVIILMSNRARSNAPAFLLGWILGILVVCTTVFFLPGIETARGEPTQLSGIVRVILGIALLLLSVRQWKQRPTPGKVVKLPTILQHLEKIGVYQSFVTGFLLSGIGPKNLLLNIAGAISIDTSMLDPKKQLIVLVVFTFTASLTVAAPVAGYFLLNARAEAFFGQLKNWLINNTVTVTIVLLLISGTLLIGLGIDILTA